MCKVKEFNLGTNFEKSQWKCWPPDKNTFKACTFLSLAEPSQTWLIVGGEIGGAAEEGNVGVILIVAVRKIVGIAEEGDGIVILIVAVREIVRVSEERGWNSNSNNCSTRRKVAVIFHSLRGFKNWEHRKTAGGKISEDLQKCSNCQTPDQTQIKIQSNQKSGEALYLGSCLFVRCLLFVVCRNAGYNLLIPF